MRAGVLLIMAMLLPLMAVTIIASYLLGRNDGGLSQCRRQFTTVETAPAVWAHCDRVYLTWR